MKTIGVVGAGTMGNGIAQVAAEAGFNVIMRDLEERFVQRGLDTIKKNLGRAVEKGKKSQAETDAVLSRIRGTVELSDLKEADVVIEAIVENMPLKKELYAQLDSVCKSEAVLASNTSGLSITEMASVTKRPEKVVGMHFFNPVPVMKLVEVIKGTATDSQTFELAMELARKLGKEPISVNEAP
ncbi:MAG TPA: 3-hydroxyacyl-CoA dehydrogenase NAD-binding domain-containing protein, partial [Bacillota bacterium]|nr:3-hydroxyacyl-CoA dehydrogenase NAD-binding domain-containing protein [Bacillota bacterium]